MLAYVASFLYHFLNLAAFILRRYDQSRFMRDSLVARALAFCVIAGLMWPYLGGEWRPWALLPILLGTILHAASVMTLGMTRTYYGVELSTLPAKKIDRFPYGYIPHPMESGAVLQLVGLYLIVPEFTRDYPYLIPFHVALSLLTAAVEHLDVHLRDYRFTASVGHFGQQEERTSIDSLRQWTLEHYRPHLNGDCSLHQYVKTLPPSIIGKIDSLRYSDNVMVKLRNAFPDSDIVPMPMTDEVYISRYNLDGGGDQGLFDQHYDGNLRYLPGSSMVRSLIYLSSDDRLEVVFDTSQRRSNMRTYDFGMLDFHRELHWVEGAYDPSCPPRILLKCNYLIDHTRNPAYRRFALALNLFVFYGVRAAMEFSKNPQTAFRRLVGCACNTFRRVNNVSPAAPLAIGIVLVALSCRLVLTGVSGR